MEPRIQILKDGPYLVMGNIPLYDGEIVTDDEGHTIDIIEKGEYPPKETYLLCRCGKSNDKPYCDGTHSSIGFDGTETASRDPYISRAITFEGEKVKLTDLPELCDHSRFCMRAGGIRNLIKKEDPESVKIAVEEATICPSGRLVLWSKETNTAYEKEFEKSILVIHDKQKKCEGPLWARGGIPIVSSDGHEYEIRNRVTLCRCGLSENKPFCDGSHWMTSQEKVAFKKKWGLR